MHKQLTDIFIASFLLFILSPFLLVISLIIRIESRGPIALKLENMGINGKKIFIYRFRTALLNQQGNKIRIDSEKTRIGKILSKFHIDEMPRLFNVVKGEMPLIYSK